MGTPFHPAAPAVARPTCSGASPATVCGATKMATVQGPVFTGLPRGPAPVPGLGVVRIRRAPGRGDDGAWSPPLRTAAAGVWLDAAAVTQVRHGAPRPPRRALTHHQPGE